MGNFAENLNLGNCFRPPREFIDDSTCPLLDVVLSSARGLTIHHIKAPPSIIAPHSEYINRGCTSFTVFLSGRVGYICLNLNFRQIFPWVNTRDFTNTDKRGGGEA